MASIRKRQRKAYINHEVLFRYNGVQTSESFPDDEVGARAFLTLIERVGVERAVKRLEQTKYAGDHLTEAVTLCQYIETHIGRLTGVEPGTKKTYRILNNKIGEHKIGQIPLEVMTRADVEKWVGDLERAGVDPKTIKNRHSLMSAALNRAMLEEVIPRNYGKGIRMPRKAKPDMVFLTPTEFWDALMPRVSPHYKLFIQFAFGTGMRMGELTALRVRDVNLASVPPVVTVNQAWKHGGGFGAPKTKKGQRTISLPTVVATALQPHIKGMAPDDLVFTNARGNRIQQGTFWGLWKKWRNDDNYKDEKGPKLYKLPRFHDLRHSHSSHMISVGMNMFDLQNRLGHESITTTADTYGHLMPEAQIQAQRAANLAFEGHVNPPALIRSD